MNWWDRVHLNTPGRLKFGRFGQPRQRQCVDASTAFYRTRQLPRNRESHITAVCGWFKSFLPNETSSGESGIPHHGSVWFVQVLSTNETSSGESGIPHHGSVWMVQVLSSKRALP